MLWTDNMVVPKGTPEQAPGRAAGSTSTTTRRTRPTIEAYVNYVCPVDGAREVMLDDRPGPGQQPAHLPAGRLAGPAPPVPRHDGRGGDGLERGLHQGRWASSAPMRRAISFRTIAPYALLRRACSGWRSSSSTRPSRCSSSRCGRATSRTGSSRPGTGAIYPEAFNEYWPWIARSIVYGGLATILAFALGFPLAYAIAFRGGAYKNLLLFLVIAPFFTSFLLRTISWKIILVRRRDRPRPAQDDRHRARPTSSCSRRRPRSSPASPTTSCRS